MQAPIKSPLLLFNSQFPWPPCFHFCHFTKHSLHSSKHINQMMSFYCLKFFSGFLSHLKFNPTSDLGLQDPARFVPSLIFLLHLLSFPIQFHFVIAMKFTVSTLSWLLQDILITVLVSYINVAVYIDLLSVFEYIELALTSNFLNETLFPRYSHGGILVFFFLFFLQILAQKLPPHSLSAHCFQFSATLSFIWNYLNLSFLYLFFPIPPYPCLLHIHSNMIHKIKDLYPPSA